MASDHRLCAPGRGHPILHDANTDDVVRLSDDFQRSSHVRYSHGDYAGHYGGSQRATAERSEEHTSELQSRFDLVCRLLLEKKKLIQEITWTNFNSYSLHN